MSKPRDRQNITTPYLVGLALLTFITNLNRKVKSRRILNANDYQMLLVNIGFCLEIPKTALCFPRYQCSLHDVNSITLGSNLIAKSRPNLLDDELIITSHSDSHFSTA